MSELYQKTDKLPGDTTPETPRLLLQGSTSIPPSSFSAVTGGYLGSVNIDITTINDIGNTNKMFATSGTYKPEILHYHPSTSEFSIFRPVPYESYYNPATGVSDFTAQVRRWCRWEIINQHVLIGDIYQSTLAIYYFASTNTGFDDDAGETQYFHYKIWSTAFNTD